MTAPATLDIGGLIRDICSVVGHIGASAKDGVYILYTRGLEGSAGAGMTGISCEMEAASRPYLSLYERRWPLGLRAKGDRRVVTAPNVEVDIKIRISAYDGEITCAYPCERRLILGTCAARVREASARTLLEIEISDNDARDSVYDAVSDSAKGPATPGTDEEAYPRGATPAG